MEIHKQEYDKFNFHPNLTPLFEAMKRGESISEITLNDKYKEKRGENVIVDFTATDYWVGMQSNFEGTEQFDYVNGTSTNNIGAFYMSWITSFRLCVNK